MKTNFFTSAAMAIAMFATSTVALADNVKTNEKQQDNQPQVAAVEASTPANEPVADIAPKKAQHVSSFSDDTFGARFERNLEISEPCTSTRSHGSLYTSDPGRAEAQTRPCRW